MKALLACAASREIALSAEGALREREALLAEAVAENAGFFDLQKGRYEVGVAFDVSAQQERLASSRSRLLRCRVSSACS